MLIKLLSKPTDSTTWIKQIKCAIDSNDYARGALLISSAKTLKINSEWLDFFSAIVLLRTGHHAPAISAFNTIAKNTSNQEIQSWARKLAIDAHLEAGEIDLAQDLMIENRRILPKSEATLQTQELLQDYLDSRESWPLAFKDKADLSLIAFYLPQFHPFPENDLWWGPGFSEWVNIADAEQHFAGHNQPRRPGGLGFYDLRNPKTQRAQALLAKKYGVSAFCYYLYWFSGKELMEEPLESMINNDQIGIDFCLCWANETWSRRWDGSESDILIEQKYTDADVEAFPKYINRFFQDRRYVRLDNKPLLLIYRPDQIPNISNTIKRWREVLFDLSSIEVHLCACLTFGYTLKSALADGFDSATEFHPHNSVASEIDKSMLNAKRFDGKIYDYREVVSNSIKSLTVQTLKDLNPCVMLGWDNTPRKGSKGNVFHFFDYYHYGAWLLVNKLKLKLSHKRHQIIFINAWNEWCEGTYLEPDRASGLLALQTTYESIYREESIPVLLTALRVVSPYYESIRLHLLEMLVSSVHSYVSLFNELYLSSTPHSHRFIAESTGLTTYYFESEKLIVYTENVSASIGRPICELQGWIASSIGTPSKAAVKIGTTHDYCKREVELEITLGPKRSDVASYHRDKGIDFKDCINWKLGLDRVRVSNTEIVQAVILIGQDGQDLARLNTHLTVHQESDLEVQALGLAASHLDILNDLCSFWQYAMKLPWQELNPKIRADLLNSYESAMNSYISLQEQIK